MKASAQQLTTGSACAAFNSARSTVLKLQLLQTERERKGGQRQQQSQQLQLQLQLILHTLQSCLHYSVSIYMYINMCSQHLAVHKIEHGQRMNFFEPLSQRPRKLVCVISPGEVGGRH
ncbi:hypothetical protein ACLKA7_012261 [Drosophila subpalustris]